MRYLILFMSTILFAANITGAFGIKLGEKADLNNIKVLNINKNTLSIIPPKTLSLFTNYEIKITPTSKLIYQIHAFKKYSNSITCQKKAKEIKIILENKYGKFSSDIFAIYPKYTYENNNKKITIECNDNNIDTAILSITYTDEKLQQKAKNEELILKSKHIEDTL